MAVAAQHEASAATREGVDSTGRCHKDIRAVIADVKSTKKASSRVVHDDVFGHEQEKEVARYDFLTEALSQPLGAIRPRHLHMAVCRCPVYHATAISRAPNVGTRSTVNGAWKLAM